MIIRLRTTQTDLNGMNPHIEVPFVFKAADNQKQIQHIVFTYSSGQTRVYIDGERYAVKTDLSGNFRNWNPHCRIVIGNEVTGKRPWLGTIYYAAIYHTALNEEEITKAFNLGIPSTANLKNVKRSKTAMVSYMFNEKRGGTVFDNSEGATSINLNIPKRIPPFPFDMDKKAIWQEFSLINLVMNLSSFIPFGIFCFSFIRSAAFFNKAAMITILLTCCCFIFFLECLQFYLPAKHASLPELLLKNTGFFMGMAFGKAFFRLRLVKTN
jgi:hypothetical protein